MTLSMHQKSAIAAVTCHGAWLFARAVSQADQNEFGR